LLRTSYRTCLLSVLFIFTMWSCDIGNTL